MQTVAPREKVVAADFPATTRAASLTPHDGTVGITIKELYQSGILVIAHDRAYGKRIKALLTRGGFTCIHSAHDGQTALDLLHGSAAASMQGIEAIVLHAPCHDNKSYALCRELLSKRQWATIPVIVLSDNQQQQSDVMHAAYAAGATDVLFNPSADVELIARLNSALFLKKERDLRNQYEQELHRELDNHRSVEARLRHLLAHDELTGLYNRRRLGQLLELAVLDAHHSRCAGALFYIDIDQFKIINDIEGHLVGDRLLIEMAAYLKLQIAAQGLHGALGRIGADEFALLVEGIDEAQTPHAGEKLRQSVEEFCFQANTTAYRINISMGVALITAQEDCTASEILARADQACHAAKNQGRNRVQVFTTHDHAVHNVQNDLRWVPLIHDALANDRFRLVFQPVLDIGAEKITHYEALIRMLDKDNQLVAPLHFIPVAERMGLIREIDFWVVTNAIDWLHKLRAGRAQLCVNVNLSAHVLQDPSLVALVKDKLRVTGIDAARITFEITETAAVANIAKTRKVIEELRALGCCFAIDDFGAGFNSYSYLKHFPVDYLKIDGAFITHLVDDAVDQALVKSMIEIARTLGKKTIAEFVENAETLALLKEYGVDYAQGYYLGKPQLA